jgi:hypothetical protein
MGMATIVICTALLLFGASITLYSEDGWMLLLVAMVLAAAFFFWLFLRAVCTKKPNPY